MATPSGLDVSRRSFLAGGVATAAGALLLGACGSDGSGASPDTSGGGSLALAQYFGGPMFVAGRALRAPFGVADTKGVLPTNRTPRQLEVQILDPSGTPVGDPVTVARRSEGLAKPYFPLVVTLDTPGIYTARTSIDGVAAEMDFHVQDAAEVKVVQPGARLPEVTTPTTADPRGVNPICTRSPACSLHGVTVSEARAAGKPLGLLVATPAFCQVAVCGPVLDVLLDASADHPDITFIHLEVFADPADNLDAYSPAVDELGLHFEPCLVLADADGTVVDRIDTIFDRSELRERLAGVTRPRR